MKTDFKIFIPHDMFEPGSFKNYIGTFKVDKISGKVDCYRPVSDISYDLDLTNTGDAFLLNGQASCKAKTECSRCLEECEIELVGQIDGYYLMEPPEDDRDAQINEFEILNAEHEIDAGELICASLIVDAPNMPLCSDDCMGICPGCGVNLNKDECKCDKSAQIEESPFAALSVLLDDDAKKDK